MEEDQKKNLKTLLRKPKKEICINFAILLDKVAKITCPELRIRFSTSNPQDMTDDVINIMAKYRKHMQLHSFTCSIWK